MKVNDIISVSYTNGVTFRWQVVAVLLGGENTESVIELNPLDQKPNQWGRTLCPSSLLDVLRESGSVVIYDS